MDFFALLNIQEVAETLQFSESRMKMLRGVGQGRRRLQTGSTAQDQLQPEIVLDRFDPLTDCGRRNRQRIGGLCQRPETKGELDRLQRFEVRRRHLLMLKEFFSL